MLSSLSPDVQVMLRPRRTFLELGKFSSGDSRWLFWRRPLFVLLVVCCSLSLMTSAKLSLHLVASTAIYWSFLPLVAILGLMAAERDHLTADIVDRFFTGYGPTMFFVVAFAFYVSTPEGVVLSPGVLNFWLAIAILM